MYVENNGLWMFFDLCIGIVKNYHPLPVLLSWGTPKNGSEDQTQVYLLHCEEAGGGRKKPRAAQLRALLWAMEL